MGSATCPYCEFDFVPDDYEDIIDVGECKIECPKCERTIKIRAEMSIDFYTKKLEDR